MAEVKVTVLMPVYNAGQYVGEAIWSVLREEVLKGYKQQLAA